MSTKNVRDCHHFDLLDICRQFSGKCPDRHRCRKIRKRLGSENIEEEGKVA